MQQHGSNNFTRRPLRDPAVGVKRSNSTFSEHGHAAYHIKENHECSKMIANIFPTDPLPPTPPQQQQKIRTWSCCISNKRYSRMQQHGSKYFARRPPSPPDPRDQMVKIQRFCNNFMLYIKLKGITNAATWSGIFCLQTAPTPNPGVGGQNVKTQLYQNVVMLHIKLKGIMNALTR